MAVSSEDAISFSTQCGLRAKGDGLDSKSLADQDECEQSCSLFFFPLEMLPVDQQLQLQELGFASDELQPRLMRDKHAAYLQRGLTQLPPGFVSLDASRPWIIYWILHGLELLDALPQDKFSQAIGTLLRPRFR